MKTLTKPLVALVILFSIAGLIHLSQVHVVKLGSIRTHITRSTFGTAELVNDLSDCSLKNGFAGFRDVPSSRKVFLYWVGPIDSRTRRIIKSSSKQVIVLPAKNTYCELDKAAIELAMSVGKSRDITTYPDQKGAAVDVEISLRPGESKVGLERELSLKVKSGIPVKIVSTSPAHYTEY